MSTTVDVCIYAVGGGLGHAVRGSTVQLHLSKAGATSVLIVREGIASEHLPPVSELSKQLHRIVYSDGSATVLSEITAQTLVIDTFADGWKDELTLAVLQRFRKVVFLARFQRDAVLPRRMNMLIPYASRCCEWGEISFPGTHVGFLLRSDMLSLRVEGNDLLVVDPYRRTTERFISACQGIAARRGCSFRLVHDFKRELRGRRFLFIGAGYNTFYEALMTSAPLRFMPLKKRYDNQSRRVEMWNLAVRSPLELDDWLASDEKIAVNEPRLMPEDLCNDLGAYL